LGSLKETLRRLKREALGELASFELRDGSRYYYDPTAPELFLFCYDCAVSNPPDWPEAPEVLQNLCEAKDMRVAFEAVMGGGTVSFIYDDIFPYSPEILVNERRLEPRSLVVGRNVYDQEVPDLSE
jgi:hypothetical protein